MTIRELYAAAIEQKEESLILLLDFLLFAKKAVKFEDDVKVLNYYYQPRFHAKMNEYLSAHNELKRIVKAKEYVEVFNIKSNKGRYFIAAQTKEQALALFQKAIGGEVYSVHAEPLELGVFEKIFREEPKEKTWHKVLTKVKKIPSIIGYYDY
jgi:tetratricopeptide (TPR) repeat protein